MGVTEELASFLVEARYDSIPPDVINRAKVLVLDFVGGALAGCQTDVGDKITEYVTEKKGKPEASIIGKSIQISAPYAAYVNGVFNHAPELEAVSQKTSPNPLAAIAASLSVGEKERASGKDLLEGFVLGFEIQARVGGASLAGVSRKGRISIFNHLGAVGSACRIMGLDAYQSRMAIGIAAFQAGGLITNVGTMAHILELPVAARDGIEAAEFAKLGVTSHPDIIEAPQGFCDALIEEGGYNLDEMLMNLGDKYQITDPGISIKKYPCCYRSHCALDALFQIMAERDISYSDIEKVSVDINLYDSLLMKFQEPKTGEEARFSYSHILGTAILKGEVWLDSFTDASVSQQSFCDARKKVEVNVHPEWAKDRAQARTPVTVKVKNGGSFEKEVAVPREPTEKQLLDRYRKAAGGVLTLDQTERSIEKLLVLEEVDEISELMRLLKKEV